MTRLDPAAADAVMRAAGLTPTVPFPGSSKPWPCLCARCGRDVTPLYGNIKRGQGGCRFCAGQQVDVDEALMQMRAAGVEPLAPFPGSNKPWLCRCERCGSQVSPTYSNVRRGQGGCGACGRRLVAPDVAAAVMRAAELEPLVPYPGSGAPWRCRCERCGREVSPRYANVRAGQGGCRFCAGVAVAADDAAARMEAVGLKPLDPYPGSSARWRCQCEHCGREVYQRHNGVAGKAQPCPYCSGRILAPERLNQVLESADLTPLEPYPGASGQPWRCRCRRCNGEVTPRWDDLAAGSSCRLCAPNAPVDPAGAAALMRAADLEPLTAYPGRNNTPWPCQCTACGRRVSPAYTSVQRGSRCPFCAGNKVDQQQALAIMRDAGLEPAAPFPGSHQPWPSRCLACGAGCQPHYANVRHRRGGCSACASNGFDYVGPGRVYLLTHQLWGAHKVGITGMGDSRFEAHRAAGWQIVDTWEVPVGRTAYNVEQAVLRWWRDKLDLCAFLGAGIDGFTETVDAGAVDLLDVAARIAKLLARED